MPRPCAPLRRMPRLCAQLRRVPRLCAQPTAREPAGGLATGRRARRCPIARSLRAWGLGTRSRDSSSRPSPSGEGGERGGLATPVRASTANPLACACAGCAGGPQGRRGAGRHIMGRRTAPHARHGGCAGAGGRLPWRPLEG